MNNLRLFLKRSGLKISDASRISGVPYMTMIQHLHGKRNISAEVALKYKKALGIPLCKLRTDLWPPEEYPPARKKCRKSRRRAACKGPRREKMDLSTTPARSSFSSIFKNCVKALIPFRVESIKISPFVFVLW